MCGAWETWLSPMLIGLKLSFLLTGTLKYANWSRKVISVPGKLSNLNNYSLDFGLELGTECLSAFLRVLKTLKTKQNKIKLVSEQPLAFWRIDLDKIMPQPTKVSAFLIKWMQDMWGCGGLRKVWGFRSKPNYGDNPRACSCYLYFKIHLWESCILHESSLVISVSTQIFIVYFSVSSIVPNDAGDAEAGSVQSWTPRNLHLKI